MKKGKIFVGTSGWLYKHWRGTFYPAGLSQKDEYNYYSLFFNTVELNNPFYRLPSRETFEGWQKNSRKDFLFIVKASRFITHMKKLKDTEDALALFLNNCNGLGKKLGPILFQLPPGWKLNLERFETFLKTLPKGYRFVFEFRNPSWYDESVYRLLKKYKCAYCIYQLAGHMSPIEVTTNFVYLRLHGPTQHKYQGSYDFYTLWSWAEKSREWQASGKDVYIYFDNDDQGYAAFNAQVIEMMLNKEEPITKGEYNLYSELTVAIRERRTVSFYYETEKEKGWQKVDPYLVAINKNGNLFFTGYKHRENGERIDRNNNQPSYVLKEIDFAKFKLLDETFNDMNIDEEKIYGRLPTVQRIVYRTTVRQKKSLVKKGAKKK